MGGYVNANIIPSTTGLSLGNQFSRWNLFVDHLDITGGVSGSSLPIDASSFEGDIGAQINSAFTSLGTGGGIVTFPSSSNPYIAFTQISIPDNCCLWLQGVTLQVQNPILVGNNSSIIGIGPQSILQGQNISGTAAIVMNNGLAGGVESTATANSNLYFNNFSINANGGGTNSSTRLGGIWLAFCSNSLVENVYVTGTIGPLACGIRSFFGNGNTYFRCVVTACSGIGLSMAGDTQWTISNCKSYSNGDNGIDCGIGASQGRVVDCESTGNAGNGFNPDEAGDMQISGGNFSSNTISGIAITNPPQERIAVIGARCYGNGQHGIVINNNSNQVTIEGCLISKNNQNGIFVNASSFANISGCEITDNGQAQANFYDGIVLQSAGSTCLQNLIIGNQIRNSAGTTQRYGIQISTAGGGTVGSSIIALNDLVSNQSGTINNPQSTDQIFGNRIDFTGSIQAYSPFASLSVAGKITSVDGLTTTNHGVPITVAGVGLSAQAAAISGHALYTPTYTGNYRISFYAKVTTAASSSSTLGGSAGFTLHFKDGLDSVSVDQATAATNAGNTTGASVSGVQIVNALTANAMTFDFDYTSSGGTAMVYYIQVVVEAL